MTSIDRRAAEIFFAQKVPGSVRSEGGRHTAYRVYAPGGRLLLGNLTLSRGASGQELDLRNLKGLAKDMGLSLDGFVEASNCRIRPAAVVLCIVARILEDSRTMHELDPISYDDSLISSLGKAIDEWLRILPAGGDAKLNVKETKEVDRCKRRLATVGSHHKFKLLADALLARASNLSNE